MTINCKGNLIDLSTPKIMGILNLTPDSFFDGGTLTNEQSIWDRVNKMLKEGAEVIDVGGQSSRPGAKTISVDEELARVLPVVKSLLKKFPEILLSIDTFYAEVAKKTVEAGAAIINDISAGSFDKAMFSTVADLQVPYVLVHMQGRPKNMQEKPDYKEVILDLNYFFTEKLDALTRLGVNDVLLDPGFGFGKTQEQNFELLQNLDLLGFDEFPVMVGLSRKSMVYKTLESSPEEALNGTTALHMVALQKGAAILRVHDVKEAKECVELFLQLK